MARVFAKSPIGRMLSLVLHHNSKERLVSASGYAMVPEPASAALLGTGLLACWPPAAAASDATGTASNRLASSPPTGAWCHRPGHPPRESAGADSAAEGATGPRKRSGTRDRDG